MEPICDSKKIEQYIKSEYRKYFPNTTYILYGSETKFSTLTDDNEKYTEWLASKGLTPKGYYLVVGRFVPENNFKTMIGELLGLRISLAVFTKKWPKNYS